MTGRLRDVPRDVRAQIAKAIRQRAQGLMEDLAGTLTTEPGLDAAGWQGCSRTLIDVLALAVEESRVDHGGGIQELSRLAPPLLLRQIIQAIHGAERVVLDELSRDQRLGATSNLWPVVADSVRAGALEVIAAFAERAGGHHSLRDQLTTLIAGHVFDLALEQEALRAQRHHHGVAMILFDIDDMSQVNRAHGYGAGDRLLERLGILARRFFRTHDWVARHGEDSIAVLLPETTLDQAATLAARFCETVKQRLVLVDHKTDTLTAVTVSAAAAGTDLVQAEIDPSVHPCRGGRRARAREDERRKPCRARGADADVGHDPRRRDPARHDPPGSRRHGQDRRAARRAPRPSLPHRPIAD